MQRLADQIQRELADLIRRDLKDPRLGMITISAVKVSKDMGYADVYVTVLGKDLTADEVVIRGNHMAALIHQAVSADEANHPNNESSE